MSTLTTMLTKIMAIEYWYYKYSICKPPDQCRIDRISNIDTLGADEFVSRSKLDALNCDVNRGFARYNASEWETTRDNCSNPINLNCFISLKPPGHERTLLKPSFGLPRFLDFLRQQSCRFDVRIINVKGINLDLFDEWKDDLAQNPNYALDVFGSLELVNVGFDFYAGNKIMRSCQDLIDANLTEPRSIFQLSPIDEFEDVLLFKCELKRAICPLIFNNLYTYKLRISGTIDSYFKTNYMRFTNETFKFMDAAVRSLEFSKTNGVKLDLNTLNPQVFWRVTNINIVGEVRYIDANIFGHLKRYYLFYFRG